MSKKSSAPQKKLEQLLQFLSYSNKNGWIEAAQFDSVRSHHRFSLSQARDMMEIKGAFCWLNTAENQTGLAPLVYIAASDSYAHAQSIHRKVWSQGLTPYLIILLPDEILVCKGFQYTSEQWIEHVYKIAWTDLLNADLSSCSEAMRALLNLRALRLRSSIFWREHSLDVSGRVDQTLLVGLSDLSYSLISGTDHSTPLGHNAANGLIGKMLYLYFLIDRGVINQQWINERGHAVNILDAEAIWEETAFWSLFDELDSIFNGSIFPLLKKDSSQINAKHIHLARTVLKHGARVQANGNVQLSFIDIDLSVLRVETLSAVYEQFLENVRSGERRRVGAYYTPPFLVDLILDRVEDELQLVDGITVLDPTAGSGVFLVGAYRRILENARAQCTSALTLDQIRDLLVRNIFGVERNKDACHVAAFSLYLTMLDYVNPRDLSLVAAGQDPKRLFPSLLDSNLYAKDFFSKFSAKSIPPIKCVVGNPPWQSLAKLESPAASDWATSNPNCPTGNDQAAELILWKALREHLCPDGFLAMLIPSKSFVNPTASRFRRSLGAAAHITGAINFSHMRHKLFVGAKHACAAIFVRKNNPTAADWTWVYSPLSISQPVASKDTWPWTLVMDDAAIQWFKHESLAAGPRGWFEAFVLRPVDRQIQRYINDSAESGSIALLGELCVKIKAKTKRGGNASDTGLPNHLLDQAPAIETLSSSKNLTLDLFQENNEENEMARDRLTAEQLTKVNKNYFNQFSGNVLLVPRNFQNVRFIEYPKAYTSSYLAVFFDKPGEKVTSKEKRLLFALERYFKSRVALYFLATTGRRWLIDRRNIEPADFACLPIPFTSPEDPRINEILKCSEEHLEEHIMNAFNLDPDLKSAVLEFLQFRMLFQDGNVPKIALTQANKAMLARYSKVFKRSLDGLIGRKGAFKVNYENDLDSGTGIIVAKFLEESSQHSEHDPAFDFSKIIKHNHQSGINSFNDSLAIKVNVKFSSIEITKPLEYFRWTIDCAYDDSQRAMEAFMLEGI